MKIGDIIYLDINYNPTVKPKLELAIIRGISTDYSPIRYYLTVIATGKRKWATKHFIYPLETEQ